MTTVTVTVKTPHSDIFGAKEGVASRLEDLGEVHIISVADEISVAERIEEFIARNSERRTDRREVNSEREGSL